MKHEIGITTTTDRLAKRKENKMRLFILINFLALVISNLARISILGSQPYPRLTSRGNDAFGLLCGFIWMMWAGYLLWVQ